MKTKFLSAVALCMVLAMASCSKKDAQVSTSEQSPEVATELDYVASLIGQKKYFLI